MAVKIELGRVQISRRDAPGLNADLLELLGLPDLNTCQTISLGTQTEMYPETVLAMLNSSLVQTLKVLKCQEIYCSPETLEKLLEFELDSLTLAGGSAYQYPVGTESFPTLETAHLAVLRSHPRVKLLKELYLPNQYLENDRL
jgi:hypothetical protein